MNDVNEVFKKVESDGLGVSLVRTSEDRDFFLPLNLLSVSRIQFIIFLLGLYF